MYLWKSTSPASLLWLHFLPATFPLLSLPPFLGTWLCLAVSFTRRSPLNRRCFMDGHCDLVVSMAGFTLATVSVWLCWMEQEVTGSFRKSLSMNSEGSLECQVLCWPLGNKERMIYSLSKVFTIWCSWHLNIVVWLFSRFVGSDLGPFYHCQFKSREVRGQHNRLVWAEVWLERGGVVPYKGGGWHPHCFTKKHFIWLWDRGEEWGELLELETSGYDHMGPQCYCSDPYLQGFIFILLMTVPDAASWILLLRF